MTNAASDANYICDPISQSELRRRWQAARARMRDAGLDALIVQGANSFSGGGYFRWFTGLSAGVANANTLIFPVEGLSTLACHGDENGARDLDGGDPAFPGIGPRFTAPNFPMAHYTSRFDPEIVAREIARKGFGSVGLVNPASMYNGFVAGLRDRLPQGTLIDATDMVDELKAIKSAEEIAFIRRAAAMQDAIMVEVREFVRPGLKEFEVTAYAQYLGQKLGSESGHFHASSAPPGRFAPPRLRPHQGREICAGDVFFIQLENSGPAGFYVHLARMIVLGKPTRELLDAFASVVDAQDFTIEGLRPGTTGRAGYLAFNDYLRARGFAEERRLHCHGQGYDTVERPLLRPEETMVIAPGMNIGIHPFITSRTTFMTVCDNFIIGSDGVAERLHKTERQVFVQ